MSHKQDKRLLLGFTGVVLGIVALGLLWLSSEGWWGEARSDRLSGETLSASPRQLDADQESSQTASPWKIERAVVPKGEEPSCAVSGQVLLAPSGEPVAGAVVRASTVRPRMETHELVLMIDALGGQAFKQLYDQSLAKEGGLARSVTAADGSFALQNIRSSRFYLLVHSPQGYLQDYPLFELPVTKERVDITLWLLPGSFLHGKVQQKDGSPIAGARLELISPLMPIGVINGDVDGLCKWLSISDEKGRYQFDALPPERPYLLIASARNFGAITLRGLPIPPNTQVERNLILEPEGQIRGRVEDSAGQAIEAAEVVAVPMTKAMEALLHGDRRDYGAQSTSEGRFQVGGLPTGLYRVYVRKEGHATQVVRHVEVAAGGEPQELLIRLFHGESLMGTVVDENGDPVAGLRVRAYRPRLPGSVDLADMGEDLLLRNETRTDEDGRFEFLRGLAPGRWIVEVFGPDHDRTTQLTETGQQDLVVVVHSCGALEGIVLSARSGEPLAQFSVQTRRGILGIREQHFEHPEGRFRLTRLPEGNYQVTVQAAGHTDFLRDQVTVLPGHTTPGLVAILQPEAVVRGRVVRAEDGEPIVGAVVESSHQLAFDPEAAMEDLRRFGLPEDGLSSAAFPGFAEPAKFLEGFARIGRLRSDPLGRFELRGQPQGEIILRARHPSYRDSLPLRLILKRGEIRDNVVLELAAGGAIEGHVLEEDGTAVAGALVLATRDLKGLSRQASTDETGHYRLAGLDPGTYALALLDLDLSQDDDNLLARILARLNPSFVTVREGRTEWRDIKVPILSSSGSLLRGMVRSGGLPLEGGMIAVAPGTEFSGFFSGGTRTGRVGPDGRYEVRGVHSGLMTLRYNDGRPFGHGVPLGELEIPAQPIVDLDLDLPEGSLSGYLVRAQSGEPLSSVRLRLLETSAGLAQSFFEVAGGSTAADGSFRLGHVPGGAFQLVLAPSFLDSDHSGGQELAPVRMESGQHLDLGILYVTAAATIRGWVRDTEGKPIAGALLELIAVDGSRQVCGVTTREGEFARSGLSAGEFQLLASAEGHGSAAPQDVLLKGGETAELEVTLQAGIDVLVRVEDQAGEPVAKAVAQLRDRDGRVVLPDQSLGDLLQSFFLGEDQRGVQRFRGVQPGLWTVEVQAAGRRILKEQDFSQHDQQVVIQLPPP